MAMQLLSTALGSFLSSGVVAIIMAVTTNDPWIPYNLNDGHMDWFFLLLALVMLVNIVAHFFVAINYKLKVVEHSLAAPAARRPGTAHSAPSGSADEEDANEASTPFIPIEGAVAGARDDGNILFSARSLTATQYSPAIPSQLR